MEKKTGLVAFFDILGYQNFLEKNEPEIAAGKIAEFIKKLKAFQSETFINLFKEKKREKAKSIIENIVYLVISDSILLTLETDKSDQKRYERDQLIFLMYCSRFFRELFVYGLPPRGTIEYGDYILVESQMFAGASYSKCISISNATGSFSLPGI